MQRTSNNARVRRFGWTASALLAAALVPGFASADELLISEITVVALAIDTAPMEREIAEKSIETALANIRRQLVEDTDSHLHESIDVEKTLANATIDPTSRG